MAKYKLFKHLASVEQAPPSGRSTPIGHIPIDHGHFNGTTPIGYVPLDRGHPNGLSNKIRTLQRHDIPTVVPVKHVPEQFCKTYALLLGITLFVCTISIMLFRKIRRCESALDELQSSLSQLVLSQRAVAEELEKMKLQQPVTAESDSDEEQVAEAIPTFSMKNNVFNKWQNTNDLDTWLLLSTDLPEEDRPKLDTFR